MRDGDVKRRQQTERARLIGSGQEDDAARLGNEVIDAGDSSIRRKEIRRGSRRRWMRRQFQVLNSLISQPSVVNQGLRLRQEERGGRIGFEAG